MVPWCPRINNNPQNKVVEGDFKTISPEVTSSLRSTWDFCGKMWGRFRYNMKDPMCFQRLCYVGMFFVGTGCFFYVSRHTDFMNFTVAKNERHSWVGLAIFIGRPLTAITQRHWCIGNVVKRPERLSRFFVVNWKRIVQKSSKEITRSLWI